MEILAEPSTLDLLREESASLLRRKAPVLTPLTASAGDLLARDLDVSPMDSSRTHKEGASRTYKGCDGCAPMLACLGKEGHRVDLEFREGSQHGQKGSPEFIRETLEHVRSITETRILMRLNPGSDSGNNFRGLLGDHGAERLDLTVQLDKLDGRDSVGAIREALNGTPAVRNDGFMSSRTAF